jgi:outer membrane protein assembly factor BamB
VLSSSNEAAVHAIGTADGQVRWKFSTERTFGTPGLLSSGRMVFFSTEKNVSALDLETGRLLWNLNAEEIRGRLAADNQHLYVTLHKDALFGTTDKVHALALATGQEKWSQSLKGGGPMQLLQDGVIYAGSLDAIDAATGKRLWSFDGGGRESAPVISAGKIFVTSPTVTYFGTNRVDKGYLQAIDAKTGKP